jgi:PAS domain S-box-containing protein
MSLDSLLHFISSSGTDTAVGNDLAFAEVDPAGRVLSINPFGRLAWGWRAGTLLDDHLRFALETLETDEPCELPIKAGGLHLRGMRINRREGWFLIGHEAGKGAEQGQQISFRSLMDRIPQPAVSVTTSGLARYVNDAAASLLEAVRTGLEWMGEISLYDEATGQPTHHARVRTAPIHDPESGFIGSAVFVEDRTDLVHGRQELAFMERADRVKSRLRELATEHPLPAAFRQAAARFIGEQAGATSVVLLGLSFVKDRLVEVASWWEEPTMEPPMSFARDAFGMQETGRFGRLLAAEEAAACGLDRDAEWWVDPVHDNDQFAGYMVINWAAGAREDDWTSSARLNEWVRLFESLYSSIQSAHRYRTTVAALDEALFGFAFLPDRGRRFHFATEQIEELTGIHPSALLREGDGRVDWMQDVIHPEDAPLVRAHHRMLQDGHESRVTYRVRHRDGSIRWLQEHATPRTDATGLVAVNGMLSDVSEQKAAEIVLMQAKKEAEQSDRSKTAFIATMSHEIRTPLGAVNGFAQLLERELDEFEEELSRDLPAPVREFVTAISERSQKLLALVHDLFELSNIEMGKASLQLAEHDAATLVATSVERFRTEAEEKGLVLRNHEAAVASKVKVDSKRFAQVLDNLLSNAVKFTDRGTVDVACHHEDHHLVIEVRDTGIGIAEENLERMFEPFSQEEDWRNRRFEGTGLGLALAGRLTGIMGGRIEADSEKGIGSVFRVRIPLVIKDRAPRAGMSGGWLTPEAWIDLQMGGEGQSDATC